MNKLTLEYQKQYSEHLIFDERVLERIDPHVKLHEETKRHPLSSSAACLNVLGSLADRPDDLKKFLAFFGLLIDEVLAFPSGTAIGDEVYRDKGYVIFEWIGPKKSPLNEKGGGRGQNRTSIDAFVLGKINGKITQILIEWKFTEGLSRPISLGKFCGGKGLERLRRYSPVLADFRKKDDSPFDLDEEYGPSSPKSAIGIYDFSPDHLYQLMRMTLLAKKTTGMNLGKYVLEDYRIVHLTHSQNAQINIIHPKYLKLSPGLKQFSGQPFHEVWSKLLSQHEREKFYCGHWDQAINVINNDELKAYLLKRYV